MIALTALALLPGCAALVNGPTQDVLVQTDPPGAQCVMIRENAVIATIPQTPAMVRVNRSPAEILVECRREGHSQGRHRMTSSNDGVTLGNVIGGGLMGMGIDSATNADKRYEGAVTVTLPPQPAGAAAGEPRQLAQATPLPAGDVSQATWVAQRTAAANASNQTHTMPVGYVAPAPAQKAEEAKPEPKPADKPVAAIPASKPAPKAAAPAATPAAAPSAAKPAATMKDPSASGSGVWRAHLASHRTEGAAINEWQELLKKDPKLYGAFDPKIEWVDVKDRGSFARLMLGGWPERKEADAACAKIRSPGRYCMAVRE